MLIFAGVFMVSVENTRSFLMLQLTTQTQSATDALGLSLAPHMQKKDIAAMDTMVNAVFDSGYYKSLKLTTMAGKTLIARQNTSRIEGVPNWFINHLSMATPRAESVITTGWKQAGRLTMTAHPGYAYKKLWDMTVEMLRWSLLAFGLSLVAALTILKAILRPLGAVEEQALAISEREFSIVENIPRTRELKRVVLAMNSMSAKLEGFINKLSERAEQMRRQANEDALTGLMNRRGFEARLNNIIRDKERGGAGAVSVLRIKNLADYNQQFGHQAGTALLVEIGKLLSRLTGSFDDAIPARITGTDFAVILPLADTQAADTFGAALSEGINKLAATLKVDDIVQIGIACFNHNSTVGSILADADTALSQAEHQGINACVRLNRNSEAAMGNEAWAELISQSLANHQVQLLTQAVLNPQREQIYREVLIRIRNATGNSISPASFVSMAERLDLHADLDRYVIEQVVQSLETTSSDSAAEMQAEHGRLGINISARSFADTDFMAWLADFLDSHATAASLICFEVTEYGLLQESGAARSFIELVHAHKGAVVVEHFGTRLSSFQALRSLKPDYIKIDGSYTRNIEEQADNRFFLQTVVDIAHGLDIQVIAEHVESEAELRSLKKIGINAVQGYLFGEPKALI